MSLMMDGNVRGMCKLIGQHSGTDAQEMEVGQRFRCGFYQPCSCRRPSYRTMPTEVARLRLRTFPDCIGMV